MKHSQETIREAIMRLSMCARRECEICKYKDRPKTELPSEKCKERANRYVNILADVCLKEKKKRKYYRKCGLCGERHEQSEMIRTDQVGNGWLCYDCYEKEGLE